MRSLPIFILARTATLPASSAFSPRGGIRSYPRLQHPPPLPSRGTTATTTATTTTATRLRVGGNYLDALGEGGAGGGGGGEEEEEGGGVAAGGPSDDTNGRTDSDYEEYLQYLKGLDETVVTPDSTIPPLLLPPPPRRL